MEHDSIVHKERREMSQTATESYAIPKRLLLLMLLYIAAAVSGLIAGQGVIFCLLTLIMVLAVLARHQAGLWALRLYTLVQLALVSFLPYILDQGDSVATGPNSLKITGFELKVPDWAIFSFLIGFCMLQVWIAFTPKVKAFFKRKMNFNLMQ